jgi:PAS domain S-box-containing protein
MKVSKVLNNQDERILILAPTGKDAMLTARFLNDAGLYSEVCSGIEELRRKMLEEAGLIFLTGEALTLDTTATLVEELLKQPPWSDIPLIVLTSGGSDNPSNADIIEELSIVGNVTLVERPVRLMTLVSTIKSAIRARRRQYEARDFLIAEIESKEALRQSEEQLRVALDAALLGAWQINLQTLQIECTDICKSNFGVPPEAEISFDDLQDTIHPDDRERVAARFKEALKNRQEYKDEYRIIRPDGTVHWILSRGSAKYNDEGKAYNIIGVTLDITERKEAEKVREELLQSEQKARAEAETANRLKDEFLATVSHELRTPLNAMLGWTTLLRSGRLKEKDASRALETIERNARTQAEIIEDLLDVSRIITGKLSLQIKPIEPSLLIKTTIESLQPAAQAKHIHLRQVIEDGASSILGDAARLQQIIWNLMSNAIKFTPQGGEVVIKLRREDEHLAISVSDTGQGIKPEFLPFVFDRFLQADGTTTRSYGGLGLGLAIVRHLVELHGGTVQAESEGEGKGATFTVRFPLTRLFQPKTNGRSLPLKEHHSANESQSKLNGLKILVVDDEVDSLEMVKTFLESRGANVITAESAFEALDCLKKTIPDVLVSDIGMPETDGFQLIQTVRLLPPERGGNVPAIALTAYARAEDKMRALRSGFQTHVSKPVEIDELLITIANLANVTE